MEKYIKTRIEQLKDDREKASDEHDVQWYTRLIQELDWALMMGGKKEKANCTAALLRERQAEVQSDATKWPFNVNTNWTQDMTGTGQYITGTNYYYNDDHGDISHDSYYPNEYNVTVTYGENK